MRVISSFWILMLLFCSTCDGQDSHQAASSTVTTNHASNDLQLSENSRVNKAVSMALNEQIDFDFNEIPWSKVEEFLEKTLDVNFVLTSSAMDDSLGADEPITCDLEGMSVRSALRIMLEQKNATFLVRDNVVKIISLDDAEDSKYFTNHFINVRPLLANISKFESNRLGKPRMISPPHGGGKMGGGQSAVQVKAAGEVTAESMLIDLIQTSVAADHWQDSGQGLATIKIIGGCVVVGCNDALADSLKDFLQDLSFHLSRE